MVLFGPFPALESFVAVLPSLVMIGFRQALARKITRAQSKVTQVVTYATQKRAT